MDEKALDAIKFLQNEGYTLEQIIMAYGMLKHIPYDENLKPIRLNLEELGQPFELITKIERE